jgi:hypothetical protein
VTSFARLFIRIADRLAQVQAGSLEADRTIHAALGLAEPAPPYTREEAAARGLLPAGFEWMPPTYSGRTVYAACRRSGMDEEWRPHTTGNGALRCRWRVRSDDAGAGGAGEGLALKPL